VYPRFKYEVKSELQHVISDSHKIDEETEKELNLFSQRHELEKEENRNEFLRVAGRPVVYGKLL
jgi:hypothetical protein